MTLLEVLIAFLVLLVALMGLEYLMLTYASQNEEVILRNEAVRVAQNCLAGLEHGRDCPQQVSFRVRDHEVAFNVSAPKYEDLPSGVSTVSVVVSYRVNGLERKYTLNGVVRKD